MSSPLTVGSLLKFKVWCTNNEQASVNNMYYKVVGITGTVTTDQDAVNSFDALMAPLMKATFSSGVTYNGVQVAWVNITPQPATVFSNAHFGIGTSTPPDLPRQTCGLISWQTAFAGRQYRGRWYQPFPSSNFDTGDGTPAPSYITALGNIKSAVASFGVVQNAALSGTATLQPMLVHAQPKDDLAPIPPPTIIIGGTTHTLWATQRRRGSFGRSNKSPI